VAAWILSLVAAAALGHVFAQTPPVPPSIVFGDDVGFRISGTTSRGARRGTLMVRVDGKWVDAELTPRLTMIPAR
jgi:hypothetical protein